MNSSKSTVLVGKVRTLGPGRAWTLPAQLALSRVTY